MSLQIKIHGQTPKSGKSICLTCKNASRVTGQNCEVIIFCDTLPFKNDIVPFRVAECGKYHPSTMPYLHEMEAMAWKIEARKRGPAGFGDAVTSTEMEIVVTPPRKDDGLGSIPR